MGVISSHGNDSVEDNQLDGPPEDFSYCTNCWQFMDDLKKPDGRGRYQCLIECVKAVAKDSKDVIVDPDVTFTCKTMIINSRLKKTQSRKREWRKVKFDPSLPDDPITDLPILNMKSTSLKTRLQALKNCGKLCRDYYQTSLVKEN
ncbi:MAG: hypothetical protein Harvfovirus6_15 [Harvfovirus sp.]|uniref:Uncharacterized protein n=1 Tax=Harvfovirus sp. TaxID=2487768 RepID=A0A3G5A0P9_9VIRU|nr:MAG: hypothetical protein Harvfovirus6_15 [Harvfovirus sp.]